jgi:tRNA U34 2-thiouridine synthase MnmA/TrmU
MFSGGLDSVIAAHLLKSQGLDVIALHFVLPFYAGIDKDPEEAKSCADVLGIPLRIEEEGEEFMEMIRDPKFGYGKNANPCVDCRIHRVMKAAKIMEEEGAVCLATGEVVGQRPMSQKMQTLRKIEKIAGLSGKLLRPLSAKLLPPTEAELAGIVDREKLLDISGRSRSVQLAYAKEHGLKHGSPGGGCLLTLEDTGVKFNDLMANNPQFSLVDFKLLAYGRHFRLSPKYRLIVSRDHEENEVLEKLYDSSSPSMFKLYLRDTTGPLALGLGDPNEDDMLFSAAAVVRFSKMRTAEKAAVLVTGGSNENRVIETGAARDERIDEYRISSCTSGRS